MMKKLACSFAALALLAPSSCAPNHHYLAALGVSIPTAGCNFAPVAGTNSKIKGELPVVIQKGTFINPGSDKQLHYIIGVSVHNALDATIHTDANGRNTDSLQRSNILVNEVDVDFTTNPSGISIPSAVIPAQAVIQPNTDGVVVFDMMTKDVSAAILGEKSAFSLLANITIKGTVESGSGVSSDSLTFQVDVTQRQPPTETAGDPNGPACGTTPGNVLVGDGACNVLDIQDFANVVCAVPTTTP